MIQILQLLMYVYTCVHTYIYIYICIRLYYTTRISRLLVSTVMQDSYYQQKDPRLRRWQMWKL